MSVKTRFVVVCMALMATVGWSAAPARASAESAFCDVFGADLLHNGVAGAGFQGRGGLAREPDLGQTHTDLPASAKNKAGGQFRASVPVWLHNVTAGSVGALTDAQIAAQMKVLNNTFAGGEGGARTGFSFVLAGMTRTDNPAWHFANAGGADEHAMKQALRRGGPETLNLYLNDGAGYLGYAFLPDIVTKPGQAYLDGVVLNWRTVPGASTAYAGQYDLGETATHEVGHWLNLEHTFFGGCNAKGDFVADTPAMKTATRGCPEGKDTCPAPGLDPIHNYMDYSFDSCYTEFSAGQTQRMRDSWLFYRSPR